MANRISLSVYISREDVYSNVIVPAKKERELNKLVASLLEAYADFPEVRQLIDGNVAKGTDSARSELGEILNSLQENMAQSEFIISEASFASESFKERVEERSKGDLPETMDFSAPDGGDVTELREEIQKGNEVTHALLRELVETLKGTVPQQEAVIPVREEAPVYQPPPIPVVQEEIIPVSPDPVDEPVDNVDSEPGEVLENVLERATSGVVEDSSYQTMQEFADAEEEDQDEESSSVLDNFLKGL